ncbi:hypothetical protein G6024_02565, partial [Dietzia maris]|nr:hypothetical protein [Dietzia maris]
MRTETPARSGGPVDSHRDPARAAALHRLASALSPPVPDRPTSVPWADLDPA